MHGLDELASGSFYNVFSSQTKKQREKEGQCNAICLAHGMDWKVVPEPVPIAGREEHRYAIEYAPEGAEDLLVIYEIRVLIIIIYVYICSKRKQRKEEEKKAAAVRGMPVDSCTMAQKVGGVGGEHRRGRPPRRARPRPCQHPDTIVKTICRGERNGIFRDGRRNRPCFLQLIMAICRGGHESRP